MTIEEKEDYLNDYCDSGTCSECIFRDGAKGCKYSFAIASECEKAYDELMEYENQGKSKDESNTTYWEIDGYGIIKADESMTKLIEFIIEKKLGYSDFHKAFLVNL